MSQSLMPEPGHAAVRTSGVVLRRPSAGDETSLVLATRDRLDADRIWDDVWPMSTSQALDLIEAQGELNWPDGQPCVRQWLICADQSDAVVGMLSMYWPAPGCTRVRIGHWVRESMRGRGLGTHAVMAALQWLRAEWPHAMVQMHISDANEPSQRLAERCGFVLERRCAGVGRYTRALSPGEEGLA